MRGLYLHLLTLISLQKCSVYCYSQLAAIKNKPEQDSQGVSNPESFFSNSVTFVGSQKTFHGGADPFSVKTVAWLFELMPASGLKSDGSVDHLVRKTI